MMPLSCSWPRSMPVERWCLAQRLSHPALALEPSPPPISPLLVSTNSLRVGQAVRTQSRGAGGRAVRPDLPRHLLTSTSRLLVLDRSRPFFTMATPSSPAALLPTPAPAAVKALAPLSTAKSFLCGGLAACVAVTFCAPPPSSYSHLSFSSTPFCAALAAPPLVR